MAVGVNIIPTSVTVPPSQLAQFKKVLSDRPSHVDPFIHLNNTYAEDDQWWIGVKRIFRQLNEL